MSAASQRLRLQQMIGRVQRRVLKGSKGAWWSATAEVAFAQDVVTEHNRALSMSVLHRFAGHELDPTARTLRCEGAPLSIGGRAFDVLLALAEADGALVSKEHLLQRAWPGLVVEEANVHVQVSALRKVLGAAAIATVAGLGYRFAWPVKTVQTAARRNNLPSARTAFVGRQSLLNQAEQRLGQTRLLTLVGIGGTGKTRLALQLATRVLPWWADGVFWLDLAPLDNAASVAEALASALGLHPPPDTAPEEAATSWLRERRVLLVLDNAEHMLEVVAQRVDDILQRTSAVSCVVTSREALGLPGEAVCAVPPLALPGPRAAPGEVDTSEAVRLFVDRAVAALPGFALDDSQRGVVLDICRRVDGIPLALELAAAQLRLVAPAQLLTLLAYEFRLWTGPGRALPRQQTLQAVIGWSVERLTPGEHGLLRAMSVCNGGATFDTAQAMAGPAMPPEDLLAGLRRLADFALIGVESDAISTRYRVLETVRQFALAQPAQWREGPARHELDERHARYHLALAEAHERDVTLEGRGGATLDKLQQEHDNLLQAFAWCDASTPIAAALGVRLAAAMRHYWTARGAMRQGLQLTLRALEREAEYAEVDGHTSLDAASLASRWWALCAAAQMSAWLRQPEQAIRLANQLLALSRRSGDATQQALALMQCSANARSEGLLDDAQGLLEESRRIAETAGDQKLMAEALGHLATIAYDRHDLESAVALNLQLLDLRRIGGHGYRLAVALLNTSVSLIDSGKPDEAAPLLREAAALLPEVGSFWLDVYLVEFTAFYAGLIGDWAAVAQLLAASGRLRQEQDMPLAPRDTVGRQALVSRALAALGEAAMQVESTSGQGLGRKVALSRALQVLNRP